MTWNVRRKGVTVWLKCANIRMRGQVFRLPLPRTARTLLGAAIGAVDSWQERLWALVIAGFYH